MASNLKRNNGYIRTQTVTHPAVPASGDPVRVGARPGVAIDDEAAGGAPAGQTNVDSTPGKGWDINVDDNEGTGIADGDVLYYHDTQTGSPLTSINNTATAADATYGIARGVLGANATGVIEVEIVHDDKV